MSFGSSHNDYSQIVPADLQGLREQQIGILRELFGGLGSGGDQGGGQGGYWGPPNLTGPGGQNGGGPGGQGGGFNPYSGLNLSRGRNGASAGNVGYGEHPENGAYDINGRFTPGPGGSTGGLSDTQNPADGTFDENGRFWPGWFGGYSSDITKIPWDSPEAKTRGLALLKSQLDQQHTYQDYVNSHLQPYNGTSDSGSGYGGPPGGGGAGPTDGFSAGYWGGGYMPEPEPLAGGVGDRPIFKKLFGDLGSPLTGLQRQTLAATSHFLNQVPPEMRALDISMPALQGILGGKPGAGVIAALEPTFQRNLAAANQQGGRFGSANAILKSRALDDFNLMAAQAAQQGQQTQLQAADALRMLGTAAGEQPFGRLLQGYGLGGAAAGQMDLATQRRLNLLSGLLGVAQQTAFNLPFVNTGSTSSGFNLGDIIASIIARKGAK